jgi:cyanophycinase
MNLALFGSGEFTPLVDDIDSYLIDTYRPHNVAVLPTAAGAEKEVNNWLEAAKQHYAKFNLPVIPVPIFNQAQANQKSLISTLDQADWIFFSGGDPSYLMSALDNSLLWETVLKRYQAGVLLAGSSAGAMIMGKFLLASPFKAMFSGSEAVWQKAFGLVDYTIFPHFNRLQSHGRLFHRIVQKSPPKIRSAWMGIDENTALIIDPHEKTIHGLGNVVLHDSADLI